MDSVQIIVLAVVQGLTEFLPISSSAHLILVPVLLQWPDQGLVFDVAVHVGSLLAVGQYFYQDVSHTSTAWVKSLTTRKTSDESRLGWAVIFATIPAVALGFLFNGTIETELRSPLVIAYATIGFALLLVVADRVPHTRDHLRIRHVFLIGLFQAVALIPGTSRSGITMTAGMILGLTRQSAARYSFLLSIPIILASGIYQTLHLVQADIQIDWGLLVLAVVLSAISAWLCIYLFIHTINKIGMMPFVIYRLALGGLLIYWFG